MTASYKRDGRAGECGAGGWAIRLEAFLLSVYFSSGECRLFAKGSLCRNGYGIS